MTTRRLARLVAATLALVGLLGLGCTGAPPETLPPDPDLGAMEPRVAARLREARAAVVEQGTAEAWGELATAYDAHGLLEHAETCYREARARDPRAFDWLYLHAVAREVGGAATDEVVRLFEAAAAARPDYAPTFMRLGAALALRGEHERARVAWVRAIALAPQSAVAHRGLGQALLALGDARGALEPLARAVSLEPRDLAAQASLAQALARAGQGERAREAVARARGLVPINTFDDPVHAERVFLRSVGSTRAFSRAQAALQLGRFEQAVQDLAIVVEVRPDDASARYWKGMAHRRLGQTAQALADLERAVALQPTLVQARLELGALFVEQGRHAEAIEQLERAASLRPLDANGHYGLGLAYAGAGRTGDARREYAAAVALDPRHPAAARLRD